MNITQVVIRNFKRFHEETFNLDGHVVIAGPNNTGKTTLLQAIAAWRLALTRWQELNDYQRHGGAYAKAPITRQVFYSVPLRAFDLLWYRRRAKPKIVIEVVFDGLRLPIEISSESSEQVYVRPTPDIAPDDLKKFDKIPLPVFVPAMTGLTTGEPVYQPTKINQLLGQGKPGDVLRNLLAETSGDQDTWEQLTKSISRIFSYTLLPPDASGPDIIAEYRHQGDATKYDIASAGSGFLQILMLLTFLYSRKGTTLLLDEPDAHLHVILQDRIYSELRSVAQVAQSQLIIATHSEIVINSVEPRELCALLGTPQKLAYKQDQADLILSLSAVTNLDIMQARQEERVLYVEGHTDLDLLCAWAGVLEHPAADFLKNPFWKPSVFETKPQSPGSKASDHFHALRRVNPAIRGVLVRDRGGNDSIPDKSLEFEDSLLKLCWERYEIESYLIHPDALARFVARTVGQKAELANRDKMKAVMNNYLPGKVVENPLGEKLVNDYKARTKILPPILSAAGLLNFPYTRYAEIANVMQPEEIHPEVARKLDAIADHLRLS